MTIFDESLNIAYMLRIAIIIGVFALMAFQVADKPVITKDCKCKNTELHGRVRVVTGLADFRVRVVDGLEDLDVEVVTGLPTSCGRWQFVDGLEDFTIEYVTGSEDFTVRFVKSLPGVR